MNPGNVCNDEQLMLYHYGELPLSERQVLERHLASCPVCQGSLDELQASLAVVPQVEVRLSQAEKLQFADQVMARAKHRPHNYRGAWGGALVTGALVVAAVLLQPTDKIISVNQTVPSMADFEVLEQFEMLQDLELLENLDLLLEMEQLR